MARTPASSCICILCKRKFDSPQLLAQHQQHSELHRTNLAKQWEDADRSKQELRQAISLVRNKLLEVETVLSKKAHSKEEAEERNNIEEQLEDIMRDYGQLGERLEARRHQQAAEHLGPGPAPPTFKPSEAAEMRCGRLQLSAAALSWQGNKEFQEDRFLLNLKLAGAGDVKIVGCCILDGHAGSLCVDWCVDHLQTIFQECLSAKSKFSEDILKEVAAEACAILDEQFLDEARRRETLDGTTMCLCLIYPGGSGYRLLVVNVGDSRAVLCRSKGQGRREAVRLSDDHKPGRADERRRIEKAGGVVDMQGVWRVYIPGQGIFAGKSVQWGLSVSRAFGDILMKEAKRYGLVSTKGALVSAKPEMDTYDLRPSEDRFIIIACDGVWDLLEDDHAVQLCLRHRSVQQAAHAVVRRAYEVGSDDNITAVVVSWHLRDEPADDGDAAADVKRRRT